LDVNSAFLLGHLIEEEYIEAPKGIPNLANKVCRFKKSLYGLEQVSWQWLTKLNSILVSLGCQQSKNDYFLFLNKPSIDITIIAVCIDDILITGLNQAEMSHVKQQLHIKFGIKDLG